MRPLKLFVAALLATGPVSAFAEGTASLSTTDRMFINNIKFLCEWAKTNAPQGNPVVIRVCAPGAPLDVQQAEEDANKWWSYWLESDIKTWEKLAPQYDAALEEYTTREERAAAAEAKRQKAARAKAAKEKLIASLPTMAVQDLCAVIRKGQVPQALEELVSRKTFEASDTGLIAGGRIALGMSENAMRCSIGIPERANRSVGSWGVHIQYVYSGLIVYVENGKVTSWQD